MLVAGERKRSPSLKLNSFSQTVPHHSVGQSERRAERCFKWLKSLASRNIVYFTFPTHSMRTRSLSYGLSNSANPFLRNDCSERRKAKTAARCVAGSGTMFSFSCWFSHFLRFVFRGTWSIPCVFFSSSCYCCYLKIFTFRHVAFALQKGETSL